MLEEMIAYQKELNKLIQDKPENIDWTNKTEFFKTRFIHLQIERLIHLLVTLTVGLGMLISCYVTMIFQVIPMIILDVILIVLFFAYILHYRKLENVAQGWYPLIDLLEKLHLNFREEITADRKNNK
jgi:hypothetical protein